MLLLLEAGLSHLLIHFNTSASCCSHNQKTPERRLQAQKNTAAAYHPIRASFATLNIHIISHTNSFGVFSFVSAILGVLHSGNAGQLGPFIEKRQCNSASRRETSLYFTLLSESLSGVSSTYLFFHMEHIDQPIGPVMPSDMNFASKLGTAGLCCSPGSTEVSPLFLLVQRVSIALCELQYVNLQHHVIVAVRSTYVSLRYLLLCALKEITTRPHKMAFGRQSGEFSRFSVHCHQHWV